MITIPDSPWDSATVSEQDVALLAEVLGKTFDEAVQLLVSYRSRDFADEWNAARPRGEDEMRRFYGETKLYLIELLLWNGCELYQPMLNAVRAAALRMPTEVPAALDHGSGVGTVALEMLKRGYATTIADIPGPTFDFAQQRIASSGHEVGLLPILTNRPDFGVRRFDLITSFDVLEHVPEPSETTARLVRALRPGGLFAVQASFDHQMADFPHHLASGAARFGGHRWGLFLHSLGLRPAEGLLWQRTGSRASYIARRARYEIWRRSGVMFFQRIPR